MPKAEDSPTRFRSARLSSFITPVTRPKARLSPRSSSASPRIIATPSLFSRSRTSAKRWSPSTSLRRALMSGIRRPTNQVAAAAVAA